MAAILGIIINLVLLFSLNCLKSWRFSRQMKAVVKWQRPWRRRQRSCSRLAAAAAAAAVVVAASVAVEANDRTEHTLMYAVCLTRRGRRRRNRWWPRQRKRKRAGERRWNNTHLKLIDFSSLTLSFLCVRTRRRRPSCRRCRRQTPSRSVRGRGSRNVWSVSGDRRSSWLRIAQRRPWSCWRRRWRWTECELSVIWFRSVSFSCVLKHLMQSGLPTFRKTDQDQNTQTVQNECFPVGHRQTIYDFSLVPFKKLLKGLILLTVTHQRDVYSESSVWFDLLCVDAVSIFSPMYQNGVLQSPKP